MDCYGPGSIAGAVIGTFLCTVLLLGIVYYIYKHIWKSRRAKHLVLETDPEQGDNYAFDNPGFKDAGLTPIAKALDKSGSRLFETGPGKKWSQWSPLGALVSTKNEKKRTLDDTHIDTGETKVVSLRSHDFTGLGFNICGNMREGIYIKDVLHRGPASESGKLNSGDRINSVRISFEHMVYEDALTILSYASPYEVQIEAKSGQKVPGQVVATQGKGAEPRHPLYRSSSSSDLVKIGKSVRQRLFLQGDKLDATSNTEYTTLSNNTTLERSAKDINSLTKPERLKKPAPTKNLSPEQLKSQLEHNLAQKILNPSPEDKIIHVEQEKIQTAEPVDNKTRFQKFGVRVLPPENQKLSPKSAELSQNDNNINLERNNDGIDEVDKKDAPPVKKREKPKITTEVANLEFERNSLNGSGIKRDQAGIPQEIPEHMLNAAVAARKNRKSEIIIPTEDLEKTPKKQKGKAPPPPPTDKLNFTDNFDEIQTLVESKNGLDKEYNSDSDLDPDNQSSVNTIELNSSDVTVHQSETDPDLKDRKTASTGDLSKIKGRKSNQGTLERAQSLDITDSGIPGTLTKKRKATKDDLDSKLSTDDDIYEQSVIKTKEPRLSLILDGLDTFQRNRLKKSSEWGNLEDVILNLNDQEDKRDFVESPIKFDFGPKDTKFGDVLNDVNVAPVEENGIQDKPVKNILWPNLNETETKIEELSNNIENPEVLNIRSNSPKLEMNNIKNAVENSTKLNSKIDENRIESKVVLNDIKIKEDQITETANIVTIPEDIGTKFSTFTYENKVEITTNSSPEDIVTINSDTTNVLADKNSLEISPTKPQIVDKTDKIKPEVHNTIWPDELSPTDPEKLSINITPEKKEPTFSLKAQFQEILNTKLALTDTSPPKIHTSTTTLKSPESSLFHPGKSSQNFIFAEKYASNNDDTNVSDDIKVSRHSLGSLERPKSEVLKNVNKLKLQNLISSDQGGVSNVTISETNADQFDLSTASELYTTAIDTQSNTIESESPLKYTKISHQNITITDTNFEVKTESPQSLTIDTSAEQDSNFYSENPSSLTIDTSSDGPDSIKSNTLTFVTEITVSTPTNLENTKLTNNNSTVQNESIETTIPNPKSNDDNLKKLPEMKFTTASYESPKTPEKRLSHIELLRSNFEKSPPKTKTDISPSKSRIPVFKMSPDKKSESGEADEKEIVEILSANVHHSTPVVQGQKVKTAGRNVTVTSIRTSSKIPSGHHTTTFRPPVPARPAENLEENRNGTSAENSSSFKQWVFNPNESSVTNIVVNNNKEHK